MTDTLPGSGGMAFAGNPSGSRQRIPLRSGLDRGARAECLILPFWRQQLFIRDKAAAFLEPGPWESLAGPDAVSVFLGLRETRPLFALDVSAADDPLASSLAGYGEFQEMRPAAFLLPDADTAILGQAKALIDWHRRHRFCPNCGAPTTMADGGYRRICPACAAEHFPRTDPVVIMLPTDGDYCLIGRNRRFPPFLYSAFAALSNRAKPWKKRWRANCARK